MDEKSANDEQLVEKARRLIVACSPEELDRYYGGWTLMTVACMKGHTQIVVLLIQAGANINKACRDYLCTPLMYACDNYHDETIQLLLDNNADVTKLNKVEKTAYDVYVSFKYSREKQGKARDWTIAQKLLESLRK